VRQWLISNGFQGLEGQVLPEMSDSLIDSISERYIELYEKITGQSFEKATISNMQERIQENISNYLKGC